ncbi:MAG: hypothetical protein Q4G27_03495 [Flavobacteriaceae bacterium]|nr:hypothetical protein [Flavobacteriaceae bacterium]
MKNLLFSLAFMLMGTFAFASTDGIEKKSTEIKIAVIEPESNLNNTKSTPCEYCVYASHGTFCAAAGDCDTARQMAFKQAHEALKHADSDAPGSSFT